MMTVVVIVTVIVVVIVIMAVMVVTVAVQEFRLDLEDAVEVEGVAAEHLRQRECWQRSVWCTLA